MFVKTPVGCPGDPQLVFVLTKIPNKTSSFADPKNRHGQYTFNMSRSQFKPTSENWATFISFTSHSAASEWSSTEVEGSHWNLQVFITVLALGEREYCTLKNISSDN